MNIGSVAALLEGGTGRGGSGAALWSGGERIPRIRSDDAIGAGRACRAGGLFRIQLSFFGFPAASARIEGTTYSIVSAPTLNHADRAVSLGRALADRTSETSGASPLIGIGRSVTQIEDVPLSRRDADQTLKVLQLYGVSQTVAEVSEVRMQTLIMRLGDW